MFITALLLAWTVSHVDPHISGWFTKLAQVSGEFELTTCQFECDTLAYWAICNTLYCIWKNDREMPRGVLKNLEIGEGHFEIKYTSQYYFHSIWIQTF